METANTVMSKNRRRSVLAGAAALTLLALTAASAEAVPRSFYGVVPQYQLGPADYTRMGQGNVGTLRIGFAWAAIDTSSSPMKNWDYYDEVMRQAALNNLKVLPVVYATPTWVAKKDGCKAEFCYAHAPRSPQALGIWRDFLKEAVRRYGPDGVFWTLNPTLPKSPVTDWQLWNEQNSPSFYQPKPDAASYGRLVREGSAAIEAVDPSANIVLGGMFYSPNAGRGPSMFADEYLRKLYRQPGIEGAFEGVALHPYAQSMKNVKAQIVLSRKEIKRAGDGGVGLWITEIGWGSNADENPLTVGTKGQARKLRQAFRYFTEHRRRLNIKTVNWFSWRNTAPAAAICEWCHRSGLFTRGGFRAKPAWREFVKFTGGS